MGWDLGISRHLARIMDGDVSYRRSDGETEFGTSVSCENAQFSGSVNSSASCWHVEFHQDSRNVVLDGSMRDEEPVGNFGVGEALGEQLEDLGLSTRQPRHVVSCGARLAT